MISDNSFASAAVGHLVGDYLLQNDWMAHGKRDKIWICAIHCMIWTLCVMLFSGWWLIPFPKAFFIVLILVVTHMIQDGTGIVRFWMTRINRQPKFVEPPMAPWSLIVVDNVWHILTIWLVWRFIV